MGRHIQICSVSGGTDLCSAFLAAAPTVPVWMGEISCAALGAAAVAYDENEDSTEVLARKDLARDMIAELRGIDARLKASAAHLAELLQAAGSTLTSVDGVGPVLAARLLGRTGSPTRFASGSHYASYTGTAPIEVASAEHARDRLSRSGDRQLYAALHLVAVTQTRMPRSAGHAYVQRKLAEGKTRNEALRCLKRRLARHLWRIMLTDERRREALPGQAPPTAA